MSQLINKILEIPEHQPAKEEIILSKVQSICKFPVLWVSHRPLGRDPKKHTVRIFVESAYGPNDKS